MECLLQIILRSGRGFLERKATNQHLYFSRHIFDHIDESRISCIILSGKCDFQRRTVINRRFLCMKASLYSKVFLFLPGVFCSKSIRISTMKAINSLTWAYSPSSATELISLFIASGSSCHNWIDSMMSSTSEISSLPSRLFSGVDVSPTLENMKTRNGRKKDIYV